MNSKAFLQILELSSYTLWMYFVKDGKNKLRSQRPFFLIDKIQMPKKTQNEENDLSKLIFIVFCSFKLPIFFKLIVNRSIILPSSINQEGYCIDS